MDSQYDPTTFSPTRYGVPEAVAVPPAPPAPASQLRALSAGEVLDRTFTLYRSRFWLFSGIALGPALAITVSSVLRLIYTSHFPLHSDKTNPLQTTFGAVAYAGRTSLLFLPATLLFLVALAIGHAATARAIADLYQGVQPTVAGCYRAVGRGWLRWAGVYLWQLWSLAWLIFLSFTVLGAGVYLLSTGGTAAKAAGGVVLFVASLGTLAAGIFGTIAYLRNSLALPIAVLEQKAVRPAIRRSKELVSGRKGRIFLLFLLLWALQLVIAGLQTPLAFALIRAHGTGLVLVQAALLTIQMLSAAVIGPIGAIGLTLFYIDERVRREGFDIELAMTGSFLPMAAFPPGARPTQPTAVPGD